jgi:hypothetical protein
LTAYARFGLACELGAVASFTRSGPSNPLPTGALSFVQFPFTSCLACLLRNRLGASDQRDKLALGVSIAVDVSLSRVN